MQAPVGGYKSPAIYEYNPMQAGEIRIGPSFTAGAGIGTINLEQSNGTGLSFTDKGYAGYVQASTNWTTSPVLPKVGTEFKLNLLEFAVKPRWQ